MEQEQKQITMDEVFTILGDLYLQLRLAQKEAARLTVDNQKLEEENYRLVENNKDEVKEEKEPE